MEINFYKRTISFVVKLKNGTIKEYEDNELKLLYPYEAKDWSFEPEFDGLKRLANEYNHLLCFGTSPFKNNPYIEWRAGCFEECPIYFHEIEVCGWDERYVKCDAPKVYELKYYPADRVIEYIQHKYDVLRFLQSS